MCDEAGSYFARPRKKYIEDRGRKKLCGMTPIAAAK